MSLPQPLGRVADVARRVQDAGFSGQATRLVLYNALTSPERLERYGEVARSLRC